MDALIHLDIFGQQPSLNVYTQICLCYRVPVDCNRERISEVLSRGLTNLAADLPWLAGRVTHELGKDDQSSGLFKVVPWKPIPQLIVKNLSPGPTLDEMRRAKFPFSMLDEDLVAPYKTVPGGIAGEGSDPTAVFAIQANFVPGGLLLTFVGHHQVMDMTGLVQIMNLFSKTCRGDSVSAMEKTAAHLDRTSLVPLLENKEQLERLLSRQIRKRTANQAAPAPDTAVSTWTYFSFSRSSLTSLKSIAQEAAGQKWISTDDALTAFIWQSVGRARLSRLSPAQKSTLGRAVDPRRYLGIPSTYPGMVNNMAYHSSSLEELSRSPLGTLAGELRLAVDPATSNVGLNTRALATFLNCTADKGAISLTATIDPTTDLLVSSWARPDCYTMDFGLGLNTPEAVRRPRFTPVEGLGYLMPRHPDGEIVVAICLREQDLARLRTDAEFCGSAIYIG